MQYKAQVNEAIKILTNLLEVQKPADRLIAFHFKNNRFIGSKDKAIISQIVYAVLRSKATLEFYLKKAKLEPTARRLVIAFLAVTEKKKITDMTKIFDGDMYAARNLTANEAEFVKKVNKIDPTEMKQFERLNFPEWLTDDLNLAFGDKLADEMIALGQQATTTIRTNTLKTTRGELRAALKEEGIKTKKTKISHLGLTVEGKANLFASQSFKKGFFEVQDEGSQILSLLAAAKPKQKVLDLCCGAGGKLLAMAADMQNTGSIIGTDVNEKRLMETKKRLKRSGVNNAMLKVITSENDKYLKRQAERFDTIFVDAPCSGTGTWRRNPDSKWNLQAEFIEELTVTQASILESAARMVKKGGLVAYATCSVLRKENHDQVENFLKENEHFELVDISQIYPDLTEEKVLQLTPARHKCDGFFIALLRKKH